MACSTVHFTDLPGHLQEGSLRTTDRFRRRQVVHGERGVPVVAGKVDAEWAGHPWNPVFATCAWVGTTRRGKHDVVDTLGATLLQHDPGTRWPIT